MPNKVCTFVIMSTSGDPIYDSDGSEIAELHFERVEDMLTKILRIASPSGVIIRQVSNHWELEVIDDYLDGMS